jgi:transcriptional regulator with XRE-family HTH domain
MSKTPEPYHSPLLDKILSRITPKQQEKVAIKMRVAARIGDALEARGMQKKELAASCELKGSSMVTKWLSGGHNFTLDTLVDIAFALGISVADLVRPAEQKVVSSRSMTLRLAAPLTGARVTTVYQGELIGRASASGNVSMVGEPAKHYGMHRSCYLS